MIDLIKGILNLANIPTVKLIILTAILSLAVGLIYWSKLQYDLFIEDTEKVGYDRCTLERVAASENSDKIRLDKIKAEYDKNIEANKKAKEKADKIIDDLRAENKRLQDLEDEISKITDNMACTDFGDNWLRVFNSAIQ